MPSRTIALSYTPVTIAASLSALLALVYVGLLAVVMSYAALTVEYAQSVRSDQATIATLEADYLARIATISASDYHALGYVKPLAQHFVPGSRGTALR